MKDKAFDLKHKQDFYKDLYDEADKLNAKFTCMILVNIMEGNCEEIAYENFVQNINNDIRELAMVIVNTKKEIKEVKRVIRHENISKIKVIKFLFKTNSYKTNV